MSASFRLDAESPTGRKRAGLATEVRLRLRTTSQSASQTAPLVGEPLAKPFTLRGLPKPLPLGEVALRSNDGEGKPGAKEPQAQR